MAFTNSGTSVCGHCRFYHLTGRRGGECRQFDVLVKASWKACSLAQPPFKPDLPDPLPVANILDEAMCGAIAPIPISVPPQPHIEPATPIAVPAAE